MHVEFKIILGPKKNKKIPAKKTKKKTITPIEYSPNKHLFPFLFFPLFNEPYKPAIPSNKKTMLAIYANTKTLLIFPSEAVSMIFFL